MLAICMKLYPFSSTGRVYYKLGIKYLAQTRSQTKSSGLKLQEVNGIGKGLDPNVQPEK